MTTSVLKIGVGLPHTYIYSLACGLRGPNAGSAEGKERVQAGPDGDEPQFPLSSPQQLLLSGKQRH